jgi:hypothetical protein
MITKRFKTILDDKIKEVLISGPKQYNNSNDSVLLPAAAPWTSLELSTILTPIAHGPTSSQSKELRIVDIKDIPTTSELQVHCLQGSREVGIQLRDREKGVILTAFVWEEAC